MKTIALSLAALAVSAIAALADPVEGTWRTQPDDNGNFGLVTISTCGANICGVLGQGYDANGQPIDSPNNGRRLLWDMAPQGNGTYAGGTIWAPDRDREYNSEMTLAGNQLQVTGIHWTGIRRSQTWTRQ